VDRLNRAPPEHEPARGDRDERDDAAAMPLPLQLDLPVAPGADPAGRPSLAAPGPRDRRPPGPAIARAAAAATVAAATLGLLAAWVLPWYVRRECVEAAATHGITLSVDQVKIDTAGFRLLGVDATADAMPGVRARAPEVEVTTRGLRPDRMTVRGAELALAGRAGALEAAFARWRASPAGGQAGQWAPASVLVDGARLTWQGASGQDARVEAADVRAELAWIERGLQLRARSDRVSLHVGGAALGPWRVDVDRDADGARLRVALDPDVPEACTVLVVGDGERWTSIDVSVPRSPLSHLGLASADDRTDRPPGEHGDDVQAELTAHYVALGPSRADVSLRGGLYGVEAPALASRRLDVTWEGVARGNPAAGVEIKKARLAVGPLEGPLTGTLKAFDDGFRLDLAWAAGPVPCAALRAGAPSRGGAASASLMLTLDSRDLGAGAPVKIDFRPELDCGAPPRP